MSEDATTGDVVITWVGHATVRIDVPGLSVLTDPVVTPRVAHLRRRVPLVPLEPVDVVLVSHLHMDHLHLPSLARTATGARVLAPKGSGGLFRPLSHARLDEVAPGESVVLRVAELSSPEITVDVVAAAHSTSRAPHSRLVAEPVGYVVRVGGFAIYFAGDSDLCEAMRELGAIDVALLPIWGWGSSLGEGHLDPVRAAVATAWIDPRHVIPIHWGTYTPVRPRPGAPAWIDDPLAGFTRALEAEGLGERLVALRPGEGAAFGAAGLGAVARRG